MNDPRPIRALFSLIRAAPRRSVIALMAVMMVASASEGFGIVLLVPLLEHLGGGTTKIGAAQWLGQPAFSLSSILLIVIGLTIVRAASHYGQSVLSAKLQHEVVDDLRLRCFGGLLHAEWRWLAERRSADHVALLVTNIGRIGVGVNQALLLIAAAASLAACLAAALLLSWQIAAVAVICGIALLLAFGGQRRRAAQLGRDLGLANRALQGQIHEGLSGVRQTKILQAEARHQIHMTMVLATLRTQQMAFIKSSALSRAVLQIAGGMLVAVIVYAAINWWQLSYAILLPLILVFARMVPILGAMQTSYHHWLHAVPALTETQLLLAETENAKEMTAPVPLTPLPLSSALELVNASFRYSSRQHPALNDVSLTINARTTTAISGRSGAGKSSLADMFMGLIMPESGEMMAFDDMSAKDKSWAAFIADPEWKKLSSTPGYTDSEIVSNISNVFLKPMACSQI